MVDGDDGWETGGALGGVYDLLSLMSMLPHRDT